MRIKYRLNLLAIAEGDDVLYAPWRHTPFVAHQQLAVLGDKNDFERFVSDFKLKYSKNKKPFRRLETAVHAGFAELIIPVKSPIVGKTLRSIELRKIFGVEPIILLSGDREERGDFSDQELQPGNTIIVHGRWELIKAMADNIRFVLVTPVEAAEAAGESRPITATLCFAGGIVLALSGVPLSLGLLTGALAMILLGIVSIDEAYRAINWKTVFMLAGLIPLGIAMDHTGAAAYVASQMMFFLKGTHALIILLAVGILATLFSLFMSNVTATVLLVPLVMIIGDVVGISPRALALLVALCASNAFALPIHQVNALLMSPGGYDNADFIKAGGIMTIIYITISVIFIYLFYM